MVRRVLLVEDSARMREAISSILTTECQIIGYVEDGTEILAKALHERPQVIVLDISLPGQSGLSILPLLREALPHTAIVMLTNHAEEIYRREAFARGADAYVLKATAHTELLPAIRRGRSEAAGRIGTDKPAP